MDVTFLGYQDLDFISSDGNHIDGVKFFYFYKSSSPNYYGYEVGHQFVPRSRNDLISQIKSVDPGSNALLDMGYNGKRAVFNGLIAQ